MSNTLIALLLVGTVFIFYWLLRFRNRLEIKWYSALLISIFFLISGIPTVKIFAAFEGLIRGNSGGGMSLFGDVFLIPIVFWVVAVALKKPASLVFDICSIPYLFTLICARVNCILSGCCLGKEIPISEFAGYRWPTRELEIIFYIILIAVLGKKVVDEKTFGDIYPIYMMSYGVFRFIIEWFREDATAYGGIHLAHIWSVISFVIGFAIYAELKKRASKGKAQHGKERVKKC